MNPTRVVHLKKEEYDLLGARPSPLGNLYVIGRHGTRGEVIALHRKRLLTQSPHLLQLLKGFKGKRIGCYCDPLPCHCHTYAQILDELPLDLCPHCRRETALVVGQLNDPKGKQDEYKCAGCLLTWPTQWSHLGRLTLEAMKTVKRRRRPR